MIDLQALEILLLQMFKLRIAKKSILTPKSLTKAKIKMK